MPEMTILTAFADGAGPCTATEIVEKTGLPRSTTFRALRSLTESGLLTHDPEARQYMLGPVSLTLGLLALRQLSSEPVLVEVLLELGAETSETVTFSIVNVPWRTCVFVVDALSDLRQVVQVGSRYPLHQGAAGQVILARQDPEVIDAVLRYHAVSPSESGKLRADLEKARNSPWLVSRGQRVAGVSGVAAPIIVAGRVIGSVTVAGPSDRLDPKIKSHAKLVQRAAAEASRRLSLPVAVPG